MKNKFLGLICILYSGIIFYVYLKNYLKNYLAPTMQKYILVASILLLIMGILLIISKRKDNFKITDLILLLPIIMLVFANDGKLSTSIAQNRSNSFNKVNNVKKVKDKEGDEVFQEEDLEEQKSIEYDFSQVDYDVVDSAYQLLSDVITYNSKPDNLVGKTVRVRGFTLLKDEAIPKGYFGIGKYLISCCAADAGFGGFIAKANNISSLKDNTWYQVEGVLQKGKDGYGNEILYIDVKKISKIDGSKEELYIYPCYSYGDGTCEALKTYDIQY